MAEFARGGERPETQLSVDDHTAADAGAEAEVEHRPRGFSVAEDELAERGGPRVIEQIHGQPSAFSRRARTGTSRHCVGRLGRNFVDALRHIGQPRHADAERLGPRARLCAQRADECGEARQHPSGPSCESVGSHASATTVPSARASAACRFVPPRSTLANSFVMRR